jgi:hypothetical protein
LPGTLWADTIPIGTKIRPMLTILISSTSQGRDREWSRYGTIDSEKKFAGYLMIPHLPCFWVLAALHDPPQPFTALHSPLQAIASFPARMSSHAAACFAALAPGRSLSNYWFLTSRLSTPSYSILSCLTFRHPPPLKKHHRKLNHIAPHIFRSGSILVEPRQVRPPLDHPCTSLVWLAPSSLVNRSWAGHGPNPVPWDPVIFGEQGTICSDHLPGERPRSIDCSKRPVSVIAGWSCPLQKLPYEPSRVSSRRHFLVLDSIVKHGASESIEPTRS